MKINILTLFPEMFAPLQTSIIKRAQDKGALELQITNIRDYAVDKHQMADDRLYGGGAGMVLKPEPLFAAIRAAKQVAKPRIVVTSPQGRPYNQALAEELAAEQQLIVVCGHYEGIDERVITELATDIISVGDFVLTGGEIAALAIADSVVRLLPGVLGTEQSHAEESFSAGLLEYPHYTRPAVFEGLEVPAVLQSGDHAAIAQWRREQSLLRTWQRRPELLTKAHLSAADLTYLSKLKAASKQSCRFFVALLHYPALNKKGEIINTSLTNLDLHDIARAATTYGVERYFLVQPVAAQRSLIQDLLDHWQSGFGARYNPARQQALARVAVLPGLADVSAAIEQDFGVAPKLIATHAQMDSDCIGYGDLRRKMQQEGGNYLLLLGTGWGLTPELRNQADYRLRPLFGPTDYNHLSVRSAASIMLDRLLGEQADEF